MFGATSLRCNCETSGVVKFCYSFGKPSSMKMVRKHRKGIKLRFEPRRKFRLLWVRRKIVLMIQSRAQQERGVCKANHWLCKNDSSRRKTFNSAKWSASSEHGCTNVDHTSDSEIKSFSTWSNLIFLNMISATVRGKDSQKKFRCTDEFG